MAYPTRRSNIPCTITNSSNTHTINYPSDSVSGDLLIMQVHGSRSVSGTWTNTISGGGDWTLITAVEDSGLGIRYGWYWAIRGSETSATIDAAVGSFNAISASIVAYDGSTIYADDPLGQSSANYADGGGPSGAAVSTASFTTVSNDSEILLMCVDINSSSIAWSGTGATEILDTNVSGTSDYNHSAAYAQIASPSTPGVYSADPSSTSSRARSAFGVVIQTEPVPPGDYSATFTSDGSFTVPDGVTEVLAKCWGGGGGGGGAGSSDECGGGAGGQYAEKLISVTPGNSYTVTVGSATSSAGSNSTGDTGNDSWFSSSGTVLAKGGAPGQSGNNAAGGTGSTAGGIGDVVRAGGNGAAGSGGNLGGAGGGGAGTLNNGGNASGTTPGTGGSEGGGDGGSAGSAAGGSGVAPGGGGGGGRAASFGSANGGPGARGQVVIDYTIPEPDADAPAETISASTTANNASVTAVSMISANSGTLTATAAANPGTATVKPSAGEVSASATANDAVASTVPSTNASAGEVSASAEANNASVDLVLDVTPSTANAQADTNAATATVKASAGEVSASASVNDAAVIAVSAIHAPAELATATATVEDSPYAQTAESTAVAYDPSVAVGVGAEYVPVRAGTEAIFPVAESVEAQASALDAVAGTDDGAIAEQVSATASVESPAAGLGAVAQEVAFSVAVSDASTKNTGTPDTASAQGEAFDASVFSVSESDAGAGEVATSVTVNNAVASVSPVAETVAVDGSASDVMRPIPANDAGASAVANNASVSITFGAELAEAAAEGLVATPADGALLEPISATATAYDAEAVAGSGVGAPVVTAVATVNDATAVTEGILVHPRKYEIEAEDRNTRIERDDRTFQVESENRNTIIGREDREHKVEVQSRETVIAGVDVG